MKAKALLGIFLILCIASTVAWLPVSHADLADTDFAAESWNKTVDYYNYVRPYATVPYNWHAYTYMTYINTNGLQLLYAGLENITFGPIAFTTPMQSIIMHYKTENTSTDVITASSFLMLMAFNDNETAIGGFPNSPDLNDTLYSSLSMGVDLTPIFGDQTPSQFSSKSTVFPLTVSADKTHWSWGMRYTNLTAFWWRTYIHPNDPHFENVPIAITRYDELQFTYNLTINKDTHRATLTENHVIGRMRDLWIWPYYFNSTGCYGFFRLAKIDDHPTIYEFLDQQKIKMSIVQYQTTVLLDHSTQSVSGTQNVTDHEVDVSDSLISTKSDTGEKVFDASFGVKETYRLYNYTANQNETVYNTYNATTRTVKIRGFAANAVFTNCTALIRHLPLVLRKMAPSQYNHAKTIVLNMTGANYFYIISYPTYSGFRIVHDPTYTMYFAPEETSPTSETRNWLLVIGAAVVIIAIVTVVGLVVRRRKTPKLKAEQ
jgi:hypothetical protein